MNEFGVYISVKSRVHELDPRVKLTLTAVLSLVVFRVNLRELAAITVLTFITALAARIPLLTFLRTLRPILFFFGVLFLVYLFFTPGNILPGFSIGPLQVTSEGLQLGILQVWKFLLLILFAALLTMTTRAAQLTAGLERIIRPINIVGLSSYDMATMISLALRFLPSLLDEANSMHEAQLARGADLNRHSISDWVRNLTYTAAPLSLSVIRHADQLVDAMEARGYSPGPRTYLYELRFAPIDYLVLCVSLPILIWMAK